MCGIAGFNWPDNSLIQIMTDEMKHRGPDDEGSFVNNDISLGHRRLAVIDTSENGHQPMRFKNLVISYNGELYNYRQLKEQLKDKGYTFFSDTDTEVVLYSYHLWGNSCVNRFNGMWALCIYDQNENIFFLSRDRFGIKPLYYYFDGKRFIFASSLKAIKKHKLNLKINIPALNFFFYQKYIGRDMAIFENCHKLEPSRNLIFNLTTKKITRKKYYNLQQEIVTCRNTPLDERLDSIQSIIVDAVEKRLVSDVPIGSFLSGGLDSSFISAIISQKRKDFDTYSIGFRENSYDELEYSKQVADHIRTKHYYEYMKIDENIVKHVVENMDEPFGDSSVIPTYLLSKIARHKSTVVLSGDGADEVFGGYDIYKAFKIAQYIPAPLGRLSKYLIDLLPPSDKKLSMTFKMKRFFRNFNADINRRHLDWMATFDDPQRKNLLNENFLTSPSFIDCDSQENLLSIQLNDIQNYLAEDILKKVDLASMLNSLEVRVPFLDHLLVPLVLSLPEKYKIRNLKTKWLLKHFAGAYLPENVIRRPKRGFTVPVSQWIRKSDMIREFIADSDYYRHNLLNHNYVQNLLDAHISNKQDNARQLWLVFVFNYWWNKNA